MHTPGVPRSKRALKADAGWRHGSGSCSPALSPVTGYIRYMSLQLFTSILTHHKLYQAHITGVVHQHCHLSQVTPGTYHWSCSSTLSPVTSYTNYVSLEFFLLHCHLSQVTPGTYHWTCSSTLSPVTSYTRYIALEFFSYIVTCHKLHQVHIAGLVHQHCHLSLVTPGTQHWNCSPTLSSVTSYTRYISLDLFQHCHLSQVTPGTYLWSCSPTLSPVTSYTRYIALELFTNIVTCHKLHQVLIIGVVHQHCHLSQVISDTYHWSFSSTLSPVTSYTKWSDYNKQVGSQFIRIHLKIEKVLAVSVYFQLCVNQRFSFVFHFRLKIHVRCDNQYKTEAHRGNVLGQPRLFECIGICILSPAHESEMRSYLAYVLTVKQLSHGCCLYSATVYQTGQSYRGMGGRFFKTFVEGSVDRVI